MAKAIPELFNHETMETYDKWIAVPGYEPVMASFYMPSVKSKKTVVIGSALTVSKSYYVHFATSLAEMGFNVITYDNGSIGESTSGPKQKSRATLTQWARELDAVTYQAISHWNSTNISYVGHGMGGQLIALSRNATLFKRIVLIATPLPYWKLWPKQQQIRLFFLWHLIVPMASRLFGKFPAFLFRFGIALPKNVALEWARWAKNPDGPMAVYRHTYAKTITAPILALSFSDDWYAPRAACEAFLFKCYHAPIEHRYIQPEELDTIRIGHLGFFRKHFKDLIWHDLIHFLNRSEANHPKDQSDLSTHFWPLLKSDFDIAIYQ